MYKLKVKTNYSFCEIPHLDLTQYIIISSQLWSVMGQNMETWSFYVGRITCKNAFDHGK